MAKKKARRAASAKVRVKAKPATKHVSPGFFASTRVARWNRRQTLQQNYGSLGIATDANHSSRAASKGPSIIEKEVPELKPKKFLPMPEDKMAEVRPLVKKYGNDCERMARDRKLNMWQNTPAQLHKLVDYYNATIAHLNEQAQGAHGGSA